MASFIFKVGVEVEMKRGYYVSGEVRFFFVFVSALALTLKCRVGQ